jgi:hypothetical protein
MHIKSMKHNGIAMISVKTGGIRTRAFCSLGEYEYCKTVVCDWICIPILCIWVTKNLEFVVRIGISFVTKKFNMTFMLYICN